MKIEERFNAKWEPVTESGCWVWTAATSHNGYGVFGTGERENKQMRRAHRLAYAAEFGPIPDGMQVLHKCDCRACVNPDHLFLGTPADNMIDKINKGRGSGPQGEAHPKAKLTEDDVREIRRRAAAGEMYKDLAAEFGIARSGVSEMVNRKTWRHVE